MAGYNLRSCKNHSAQLPVLLIKNASHKAREAQHEDSKLSTCVEDLRADGKQRPSGAGRYGYAGEIGKLHSRIKLHYYQRKEF